jgi:hypothetical protein
MHVSHYLLLGFFSGPPAEPPAAQQPAGGATRRPRFPVRKPVTVALPPDFTEFINREEEDALVLCGALG